MHHNCGIIKEMNKDIEQFLFGGIKDRERMTTKELGIVLRRAHLLNLNIYGIDVIDKERNLVEVVYWGDKDKYWYLHQEDYLLKEHSDKFFSITYGTDTEFLELMEKADIL